MNHRKDIAHVNITFSFNCSANKLQRGCCQNTLYILILIGIVHVTMRIELFIRPHAVANLYSVFVVVVF